MHSNWIMLSTIQVLNIERGLALTENFCPLISELHNHHLVEMQMRSMQQAMLFPFISSTTTGKNWFELLTASLNHVLSCGNDSTLWPLLVFPIFLLDNRLCKHYFVLNHVFLNLLHPPCPVWLNIFHDVSKLTIKQHTHTAQLYFADRFSLFDQ